jgi:hypothetical protein
VPFVFHALFYCSTVLLVLIPVTVRLYVSWSHYVRILFGVLCFFLISCSPANLITCSCSLGTCCCSGTSIYTFLPVQAHSLLFLILNSLPNMLFWWCTLRAGLCFILSSFGIWWCAFIHSIHFICGIDCDDGRPCNIHIYCSYLVPSLCHLVPCIADHCAILLAVLLPSHIYTYVSMPFWFPHYSAVSSVLLFIVWANRTLFHYTGSVLPLFCCIGGGPCTCSLLWWSDISYALLLWRHLPE